MKRFNKLLVPLKSECRPQLPEDEDFELAS